VYLVGLVSKLTRVTEIGSGSWLSERPVYDQIASLQRRLL